MLYRVNVAKYPKTGNLVAIDYCAHGEEVSQTVTAALRAAGREIYYLEGGIGAWDEARLPRRRKLDYPPWSS